MNAPTTPELSDLLSLFALIVGIQVQAQAMAAENQIALDGGLAPRHDGPAFRVLMHSLAGYADMAHELATRSQPPPSPEGGP